MSQVTIQFNHLEPVQEALLRGMTSILDEQIGRMRKLLPDVAETPEEVVSRVSKGELEALLNRTDEVEKWFTMSVDVLLRAGLRYDLLKRALAVHEEESK